MYKVILGEIKILYKKSVTVVTLDFSQLIWHWNKKSGTVKCSNLILVERDPLS